MLAGFTLTSGATRPVGDMATLQSGGGAWCSSTNAELANCVITNCRARGGGGVYRGALNQCTLVGNAASQYGGGAYDGLLFNCLVTGNESGGLGGGVYGGWLYNCALIENSARAYGGGGHSISFLVNCTVTRNTAGSISGGISWSALTNCIAYFNSAPASANLFGITAAAYVCSSPLRSGPGNTSDDPQLVDGFHLAVTSPCRGMGSSLVAIGADIDGEAWASPPSMGCDEVWESGLTGPLSVSLTAAYPEVAAYGAMPLTGEISGSATRLEWSFGDGPTYTNLSCFTLHTWAKRSTRTIRVECPPICWSMWYRWCRHR